MRSKLVVTVIALVTGVACGDSTSSYGGGGGGPGCTPTATQLCMRNTLFDPATKTVTSGTTLTWKNGDPITHTTTSNPSNPAACPTWNSQVASGATSAGVAFSTGGVTCQYYCSIHATPTTGAMRASITVQ